MSQQRKLSILTILASIISISAVAGSLGSLQAQEGEKFSATLSGKCHRMDQVPNQRQWNTSIVLDEPDGAERDNWSPYT
jgi:hypothetical protein